MYIGNNKGEYMIKVTSIKKADQLIQENGYYKMYIRTKSGYIVFKTREDYLSYEASFKA